MTTYQKIFAMEFVVKLETSILIPIQRVILIILLSKFLTFDLVREDKEGNINETIPVEFKIKKIIFQA